MGVYSEGNAPFFLIKYRNEIYEQGFLKYEVNTLLPSLHTSKILAHKSHFYTSSSFATFIYSSISLLCSSNGTLAYSWKRIENLALPCVIERSELE
jgi:hypothetical protein